MQTARYLPNPEANWGPKRKAGRYDKSDRVRKHALVQQQQCTAEKIGNLLQTSLVAAPVIVGVVATIMIMQLTTQRCVIDIQRLVRSASELCIV